MDYFAIMEDVLIYDFCKINIYNRYTIVEINEGVHLTPEHNTVLVNLVDTYYRNRPFVYITNRIHNYTVDPSIYPKTSEIKNLLGFAIVSQVDSSIITNKIGHLFKSVHFKAFSELESALDWANFLLNKH